MQHMLVPSWNIKHTWNKSFTLNFQINNSAMIHTFSVRWDKSYKCWELFAKCMSKCVLFADTLTAAHQINTLQGEFTLNLIFYFILPCLAFCLSDI